MDTQRYLKNLQFDSKSVLAGIMIGLGSIIYCMCYQTSSILGSFLFSLGLLSVIVQEYNLYTGKIGYMKFTWSDMFQMVRIILGNILGVILICVCVSYTRIYPMLIENADMIMTAKYNDSILSLFCLGIGCGIMMYLAVSNFWRQKHPIFVILPIMFFITCCFEHCIADVGYFVLSSVEISWDVILKFLAVIAGNTVGSIILYRGNNIISKKSNNLISIK